MDEAMRVRDLLERTTVPEPPIGPVVQNALRVGIKLRRRRRVRAVAAGAAVVAVICAAALVMSGATGNQPATPASNGATVYVLGTGMTHSTVTPIAAATNTPGQPIALRPRSGSAFFPGMAITPNGKTIYAFDGPSAVLPISTTRNRTGRPIDVVHNANRRTTQLAVTPDGKTLYVLDSSNAVIPISTATNRPGTAIQLGPFSPYSEMAVTPDGKTLYVAISGGESSSYVIPITTATNMPGKRITVAGAVATIVAAPDGKIVYLVGNIGDEIEVTPIATATNTPGKPIIVAAGNISVTQPVVMTPDGQTIYITDSVTNGANINVMDVIAFATATNRNVKTFRFDALSVDGMAITPDGRTLYVVTQPPGTKKQVSVPGDPDAYSCVNPPGEVTPIVTATNTAGRRITVGCRPMSIAITPDGKTIYVAAMSDTVTPIDTATDRPGTPVEIVQPEAITIAP
jgi:DNA-binding beta-propeller fold protein YncE